jgi:hypothetical protein
MPRFRTAALRLANEYAKQLRRITVQRRLLTAESYGRLGGLRLRGSRRGERVFGSGCAGGQSSAASAPQVAQAGVRRDASEPALYILNQESGKIPGWVGVYSDAGATFVRNVGAIENATSEDYNYPTLTADNSRLSGAHLKWRHPSPWSIRNSAEIDQCLDDEEGRLDSVREVRTVIEPKSTHGGAQSPLDSKRCSGVEQNQPLSALHAGSVHPTSRHE